MAENFISISPKENKIRIFEFGEKEIKTYTDKTLVLKNANVEIDQVDESIIILPPLGFKFSCKVDEEKIVCEVEKSE